MGDKVESTVNSVSSDLGLEEVGKTTQKAVSDIGNAINKGVNDTSSALGLEEVGKSGQKLGSNTKKGLDKIGKKLSGDSIEKGFHNVTDMVGLTDYAGEEEAKKIAKEQSDRSYKLTTDEIAFQRQQYNDWKNIYGDLQEDLGTYFKNLTGNKIAAEQVSSIQRESQAAQTQIDQALAQRGISGGGLEAQALQQNMLSSAMQKANVRASADQLANQQKAGFLGLGLGQGAQMLGVQAGVSNTGAGNAAGMSNTALGVGSQLSQANIKSNMNTLNQGLEVVGSFYKPPVGSK